MTHRGHCYSYIAFEERSISSAVWSSSVVGSGDQFVVAQDRGDRFQQLDADCTGLQGD
jgi:hypothetical protein